MRIRFRTSPALPYHGHETAEANRKSVVDLAAHLLQVPGKRNMTPEMVNNEYSWQLDSSNDWKIHFYPEDPSMFSLDYRYGMKRLGPVAALMRHYKNAVFFPEDVISSKCQETQGFDLDVICGNPATHAYQLDPEGDGWHSLCAKHHAIWLDEDPSCNTTWTIAELVVKGWLLNVPPDV